MGDEDIIFGQSLNSQFLKGLTHSAPVCWKQFIKTLLLGIEARCIYKLEQDNEPIWFLDQ